MPNPGTGIIDIKAHVNYILFHRRALFTLLLVSVVQPTTLVSINDGSLDLKKGGVYIFYSLFARRVPNQAPSQSTSLIM